MVSTRGPCPTTTPLHAFSPNTGQADTSTRRLSDQQHFMGMFIYLASPLLHHLTTHCLTKQVWVLPSQTSVLTQRVLVFHPDPSASHKQFRQ